MKKDRVIELAKLVSKNWWKLAILAAIVIIGVCAVPYVVGKTGVTVQKGDMIIKGGK